MSDPSVLKAAPPKDSRSGGVLRQWPEWGSAQAVAVLGSILRLISSPASISAFWRS